MRMGDDTSAVQARGIEAAGTHFSDVRSAAQLQSQLPMRAS